MAYGDFSLDDVRAKLGTLLQDMVLFEQLPVAEPSAWLLETLDRGKATAFLKEKSRSEFVVAPILLEARERSGRAFSIYSGEGLNVDVARGLVGECDFVLSAAPPLPVVQAPIMIVLEAKRGEIDTALGQCAAQMVGAQLFNEKHGRGLPAVFGCVTTGEIWQFLRLHDSTLAIDPTRLYLNNLGSILGMFEAIVAFCLPGLKAA